MVVKEHDGLLSDKPEQSIVLPVRSIRDAFGLSWQTLLDIGLAFSLLLFLFHEDKILHFHVVFVILTLAAFYWTFRRFAIRTAISLSVIAAGMTIFVASGMVPMAEVVELPLMTLILVMVFAIARQRSLAEETLREANDALESRVLERTAALRTEIEVRQQTEQTLRESEERLRRIFDLSFEGIVIHIDQRFVFVNPSCVDLFGAREQSDLIGRSIWDFIHPESRVLSAARLSSIQATQQGAAPVEQTYMRLDGSPVDVEVVSIPIVYQGKAAVQSVVRDITSRKAAEQARAAERLRIAHDLHDSLGQTLGYLHLKLDQYAGAGGNYLVEAFDRDLSRMRDVANEAYQIVRAMLAGLMPESAVPFPMALPSMAKVIGQENGFEVQVVSHGDARDLSPIARQQLLFVCREALTNVAKHAQATHVGLDICWGKELLTVTVTDDGCGVAVEAAPGRTTYGLRIMADRIAQINGAMAVESEPGVGTQLQFQVPYSAG